MALRPCWMAIMPISSDSGGYVPECCLVQSAGGTWGGLSGPPLPPSPEPPFTVAVRAGCGAIPVHARGGLPAGARVHTSSLFTAWWMPIRLLACRRTRMVPEGGRSPLGGTARCHPRSGSGACHGLKSEARGGLHRRRDPCRVRDQINAIETVPLVLRPLAKGGDRARSTGLCNWMVLRYHPAAQIARTMGCPGLVAVADPRKTTP